jgi:hypothetical protein
MTSFGMDEDKMFYHCCYCGGIYADKERSQLILKIDKGALPRVLQSFTISSGLCKKCYEEYKINKEAKEDE